MSSRPPPTPDPKLRNSSLQKYPLTSSSWPQQPCNSIHQHPSNRHIQPLACWPRPAPPPRPSPPLPRRLVLLAPFHPVTTAPSVPLRRAPGLLTPPWRGGQPAFPKTPTAVVGEKKGTKLGATAAAVPSPKTERGGVRKKKWQEKKNKIAAGPRPPLSTQQGHRPTAPGGYKQTNQATRSGEKGGRGRGLPWLLDRPSHPVLTKIPFFPIIPVGSSLSFKPLSFSESPGPHCYSVQATSYFRQTGSGGLSTPRFQRLRSARATERPLLLSSGQGQVSPTEGRAGCKGASWKTLPPPPHPTPRGGMPRTKLRLLAHLLPLWHSFLGLLIWAQELTSDCAAALIFLAKGLSVERGSHSQIEIVLSLLRLCGRSLAIPRSVPTAASLCSLAFWKGVKTHRWTSKDIDSVRVSPPPPPKPGNGKPLLRVLSYEGLLPLCILRYSLICAIVGPANLFFRSLERLALPICKPISLAILLCGFCFVRVCGSCGPQVKGSRRGNCWIIGLDTSVL